MEGERVKVGAAWGPYALPADWAEQSRSYRHGKSSVGALLSAGAAKNRSLCTTTITTRKEARGLTQ